MVTTLSRRRTRRRPALLAFGSPWTGEALTDKHARLRELVVACQRGERQAFDHLVRFIEAPMLRLATMILRDPVSAEDAFIEAMAKVLPRIGELEDPNTFLTYARRAVRHAAVDLRRSRHLRDAREALKGSDMITREMENPPAVAELLSNEGPSPENNAMVLEDLEKIEAAINALKEPRRTMVEQFYLRGMTYEELADFHRTSKSTIKRNLGAARVSIAARVRQEGPSRDA